MQRLQPIKEKYSEEVRSALGNQGARTAKKCAGGDRVKHALRSGRFALTCMMSNDDHDETGEAGRIHSAVSFDSSSGLGCRR
jgi:hypothetical protein